MNRISNEINKISNEINKISNVSEYEYE